MRSALKHQLCTLSSSLKNVVYVVTNANHTPDVVSVAGSILYDVYIKELGWKFGKDNPSQIRVERCSKTGG